MANNKLGIFGGSGLYDVEEFKDREFINLDTPWGKPSDSILKTISLIGPLLKKQILFLFTIWNTVTRNPNFVMYLRMLQGVRRCIELDLQI